MIDKIIHDILAFTDQSSSSVSAVKRLSGGINSHVYKITTGSRNVIIKIFLKDRTSSFKRFNAEIKFLKYVNQLCNSVPRLIAVCEHHQAIVIQYIEGSIYRSKNDLTPDDLSSALLFLNKLGSHDTGHLDFISHMASDGYLKVSDHLRNIERRLENMTILHLPKSLQKSGKFYLEYSLSLLDRETNRIHKDLINGDYPDEIRPEDLRISPGDFGFHNAIKTERGPIFYDFEHSGLDDPAKTISDFILQPRIPVAKRDYRSLQNLGYMFSQTISSPRSVSLFKVLKLKWLCIILGVLSEERLFEIMSATSLKDPEPFIEERFDTASRYI